MIAGGIELPFNGCPRDACDNLSTGDCSVEEGEELVYDMAIPILAAYPTIEIEGKWMLTDDSGENFLCFQVPMKIEPWLQILIWNREFDRVPFQKWKVDSQFCNW